MKNKQELAKLTELAIPFVEAFIHEFTTTWIRDFDSYKLWKYLCTKNRFLVKYWQIPATTPYFIILKPLELQHKQDDPSLRCNVSSELSSCSKRPELRRSPGIPTWRHLHPKKRWPAWGNKGANYNPSQGICGA